MLSLGCSLTRTNTLAHTHTKPAGYEYCKQLTNQAVSTCANADKWASVYVYNFRGSLSWSPPCICPIVSVSVCTRIWWQEPATVYPIIRPLRASVLNTDCTPHVIYKGIVASIHADKCTGTRQTWAHTHTQTLGGLQWGLTTTNILYVNLQTHIHVGWKRHKTAI